MKKKVTIVLAYIAIVAVCYWLTFYVNPILGFIAVGIASYTLAKVSMKGVEWTPFFFVLWGKSRRVIFGLRALIHSCPEVLILLSWLSLRSLRFSYPNWGRTESARWTEVEVVGFYHHNYANWLPLIFLSVEVSRLPIFLSANHEPPMGDFLIQTTDYR